MHRNNNRHRKQHRSTYSEEDDVGDESRTMKVRCLASKEASLDDIVHSYGGLDAIRLSGDNIPSHVVTAYKELNNIRRLHGEDIVEDELFDFQQFDSNTIKLINKDIFCFLQSLFNESSREQDDRPFAAPFGTRQTTQMDGSIVKHCRRTS